MKSQWTLVIMLCALSCSDTQPVIVEPEPALLILEGQVMDGHGELINGTAVTVDVFAANCQGNSLHTMHGDPDEPTFRFVLPVDHLLRSVCVTAKSDPRPELDGAWEEVTLQRDSIRLGPNSTTISLPLRYDHAAVAVATHVWAGSSINVAGLTIEVTFPGDTLRLEGSGSIDPIRVETPGTIQYRAQLADGDAIAELNASWLAEPDVLLRFLTVLSDRDPTDTCFGSCDVRQRVAVTRAGVATGDTIYLIYGGQPISKNIVY